MDKLIPEENIIGIVAKEMQIRETQVNNTCQLLDNDNTVPFIARYRKEKTGNLDENQIRKLFKRLNYLRNLASRKQTALKSIDKQGKLTPELQSKIVNVTTLQDLEDLYLPYRPKKRTRGVIAKEQGLEPLAMLILEQEISEGMINDHAFPFVNQNNNLPSVQQVIQGALDIISEIIGDNADIRKIIRDITYSEGVFICRAKESGKRSEYEMYYDYKQKIEDIPPHRILAINRGEKENFLKVSIEIKVEQMLSVIYESYIKNQESIFFELIKKACDDSYSRIIRPAIEREFRTKITRKSEDHAITVFSKNLRSLLLQPPVTNKRIMGIDPGFRTGCKIAVIDEMGKYLGGDTIYPHEPQNKKEDAKTRINEMIEQSNINVIAIGNGTASRETEDLIAEIISECGDKRKELMYTIVSEAGASVYSASKVAGKEFPDLDASMRGNISIARRLLDPLSELVKIDPKSIGVGMYQHDINQQVLEGELDSVVESSVNYVGINLNTASSSLLRYVSGFNSRIADNIVKYREDNGVFKECQQLMKVEGIGSTVFEQSAGFLRIPDGINSLDNTGIHPESYDVTQQLLYLLDINQVRDSGLKIEENCRKNDISYEFIADQLGIGLPTLKDIIENLKRPGLDPRDKLHKPIFRKDVLKLEDLKENMILKGTVRNVVDFGAFVDIGIKQDGLVHISQLGDRYIKTPLDIVSVGDVIKVKVTKIDVERNRVSLSMRLK